MSQKTLFSMGFAKLPQQRAENTEKMETQTETDLIEEQKVSDKGAKRKPSDLQKSAEELEESPKSKILKVYPKTFQKSWLVGREGWLKYDKENHVMTCHWCKLHYKGGISGGGAVWITGGCKSIEKRMSFVTLTFLVCSGYGNFCIM